MTGMKGYKPKSNESTLRQALEAMVEAYRLKPKLVQVEVRDIWKKKMGYTIASNTREIRIWGKKLFLTIDNASLRQEMHFQKEKIIQMMNEELGESFLEDVIVR